MVYLVLHTLLSPFRFFAFAHFAGAAKVQKFAVLSAYFGAKGKATVEYCIEYRH
jgi:SpoU rRNA methylase family enzyme